MKHKALIIQLLVGLAVSFLLMWQRGLFEASETADRILIISDGFTLVSFLYLGIGSLMWVSTTGVFDIFSFAFKKAAHALIPGKDPQKVGKYYEYRLKKKEKQKEFRGGSSLIVGAILLGFAIVMTVVWYGVAE